jgi:hypothetical protein
MCETKEDLDFCIGIRYMGRVNDLSHDRACKMGMVQRLDVHTISFLVSCSIQFIRKAC